MAYYVKPPCGRILLRVLEEGTDSRMKLLMNIYSQNFLDTEGINIEHLMENSPLDRASHFVLRLACLFSTDFKTFFIQTETKFFEERLSSYESSDVRKNIAILKRHLEETVALPESDESLNLFAAIRHTCSELLKGKALKHAFNRQHSEDCREHIVLVSFQYCISLVRRREVDLKRGLCQVHCGVWGKLLSGFFQTLLLHGVEDLVRSTISQAVFGDIRLKSIITQMLQKFSKTYKIFNGMPLEDSHIKADAVDRESEFFPPCALNILQNLRNKHRVGHHARIQLTLFLKGIGMDVKEAIEFWKEEYSKVPHCNENEGSPCCHTWKNDHSRYVYNIQHLYGLQGSCKNYHTRSCTILQSAGGNGEEGCPFVTMNFEALLKVLPRAVWNRKRCCVSNVESLLQTVKDLASQRKPTEACRTLFAAHCEALQLVGVADDELVSEDKSLKCTRKENVCEQKQGSCIKTNEGTINDGKASSPSEFDCISSSCSMDLEKTTSVLEVDSLGDGVKSKEFLNGLTSQNKNCYLACTPETTLNYPTQYYLSLQSKLVSVKEKVSCACSS